MLHPFVWRHDGSVDGGTDEAHVSHFYSVYTKTEPFVCNNPLQSVDVSLGRYESVTGNVFNLYPYGRAVHTALTQVTSICHALSRWIFRTPQTDDFDLIIEEISHSVQMERFIDTYEDNDHTVREEYRDLFEWMFCRASKLFPSQHPKVVEILFAFSDHAAFDPRWGGDTLDGGWYAWLLIWYGQLTVGSHPVVAGIRLGFGLSLQICYEEVRDLLQARYMNRDPEAFDDRLVKIDMCLRNHTGGSEDTNELFRTVMSWSLAVVVFRWYDPRDFSREIWTHASGVTWAWNATDPFSRAVLRGEIGNDAETTALYMLLQLLDWKRSVCLKYWPYSFAYLARHFHRLVRTDFGGESVGHLVDMWSFEHRNRSRTCFTHTYFTENGGIGCCIDNPDETVRVYRRIQVKCPKANKYTDPDFANNSLCQMGQVAFYLSIWHAGAGDITTSNFWLSNIYKTPLDAPNNQVIQWHEGCRFHQEDPEEADVQVSLSFLNDESGLRRTANYESDGVFDYITNAAVDILRGFHYNAIRKGRFSTQDIEEWPEISKYMAQLLLGPGMQNAAAQDADFARFLMDSGNVAEGATLREKGALRAWDTYGKKCPDRILRKTIIDSISWFTSQKKLPVFCFIENPLSVTCPAVQNGLRKDGGLIGGNKKDSFIKRIWKGLRRSGG
ncbi:hypothetical protein CCHR01_13706 [Colletotrichum chrysophilum]|uniref:Uncharacterized protein n=1 Tax=Colletotrichum chrysophilum TaxID=1836956 RepID=A0AAD9A9N9_9PEZI|nr:hypothetical protein CCHR01_13706 [Colletotrichum chrysophilum]